jgi:PadR family transcriptional regulator PadR
MPALQAHNACIVDMAKTPSYLGEFEYAVLLAVLQLKDAAYAVPVRELIESRTSRAVARGALYTALERLEAKGCLQSTQRDASDARGGRPRRYFTVTSRGLAALRTTHAALRNLTTGLEAVLEQS